MACAQALLLSRTPDNVEKARNLIASLLTRNFGEYVFRIGAHPPTARVYAGQAATEEDTWLGTRRTAEELDVIIQETTTLVDEVGGKVCRFRDCPSRRGEKDSSLERRQHYSTQERTLRGRHCSYDYHRPTSLRRRRCAAQ